MQQAIHVIYEINHAKHVQALLAMTEQNDIMITQFLISQPTTNE